VGDGAVWQWWRCRGARWRRRKGGAGGAGGGGARAVRARADGARVAVVQAARGAGLGRRRGWRTVRGACRAWRLWRSNNGGVQASAAAA